jgi:pimeloyl-ACP methyl ester carboxylesterase
MTALVSLGVVCVLVVAESSTIQSQFKQVQPVASNQDAPRKDRAIVLIHGFRYYFRDQDVPEPRFHSWQKPGSLLVQALARQADVFAFSYGQNATIAEIVTRSSLRENLDHLHKLGYHEIVLIAHSAGGLIARRLIEDYPTCGVTKVIQVCCPNAGALSASLGVHKAQQAFVHNLSFEGRRQDLLKRAKVRIPKTISFVCVVALGALGTSDGVVTCASQWSPDLRKQGIPAVPVKANHRTATRGSEGVKTLVRLVHDNTPRWTQEQVSKEETKLFRK